MKVLSSLFTKVSDPDIFFTVSYYLAQDVSFEKTKGG